MKDNINHPAHYTSHPSGIECIEVTQWFDFCTGNAIKYLWRAGLKDNRLEDLRKAKFYVERLIIQCEKENQLGDGEDRPVSVETNTKHDLGNTVP